MSSRLRTDSVDKERKPCILASRERDTVHMDTTIDHRYTQGSFYSGGFAFETRVSKYVWNQVPASGAGTVASDCIMEEEETARQHPPQPASSKGGRDGDRGRCRGR